MKRLATSLIIVVLGLVFCCAVTVPVFPMTYDEISVSLGKGIFDSRCASCHSFSTDGDGFGPTLYGLSQRERAKKNGLIPYLHESITKPDAYRDPSTDGVMPANIASSLSRRQLADLMAYICQTESGFVDFKAIREVAGQIESERLPPEKLSLVAIERGRELFVNRHKCTICHQLDPHPSTALGAPSLLSVGNHDYSHLKESILVPDAKVATSYTRVMIDELGRVVAGRLLSERENNMELLVYDAQGVYVESFDVDDLEPFDDGRFFMETKTSSMPSYGEVLSQRDLDDLIQFLKTLR